MKKIAKTLMLVLLTMIMCLTSMPISASEAENSISPRLSHTNSATFTFIPTPYVGYIDVSYMGVATSFVSAKLTVTVEKRYLLIRWNEIGTWTSTSTDVYGSFYYEMALDGYNYYRATFVLEVTGVDGTVDIIDSVIESRSVVNWENLTLAPGEAIKAHRWATHIATPGDVIKTRPWVALKRDFY